MTCPILDHFHEATKPCSINPIKVIDVMDRKILSFFMSMNFPALEAFYWAAQLRSFNKAADRLNITQPTISYRIRELEGQLGVSLFIRRRQVELTSEGEALKRYAEQMIGIAQDIESNICVRNLRLPSLRVGVIDSFGAIALPALLKVLDERFSETRISVAVNTSHDLAQQLSEGHLDIALLSTPPKLDNLDLELLGFQSVAWLGSSSLGLPIEGATENDLLGQRILTTPPPSNIYDLTTNALGGTLHHPLRMSYCNNLSVIVRLVEAGSGIGILPVRLLQKQIRKGDVQIIGTPEHLPKQEVFVGRNKGFSIGVLREVTRMIRDVSNEEAFCQ